MSTDQPRPDHRYRLRPADVEARPFTADSKYQILQWVRECGATATEAAALDGVPLLLIKVPGGNVRAEPGHWVVRDAAGAFSTVQPQAFASRYEPAVLSPAVVQRPDLTGVLYEIAAERARQDETVGEPSHPDGTGQYPETVDADVARMACEQAAKGGYLDWLHILRADVAEAFAETDPVRLRAGLIRTAAVAAGWAHAIDRRAGRGSPPPPVETTAGACAQHPHAPVIGGHCGGCTVYPADVPAPLPGRGRP
ncbi:hypothetical protein [Streptomyces sp. NPDC050263]|uniref:hypothetical protein n=1 Tax=Streptomyces sp. NPDC050263 TaxID=3155037 RepID=UPI003429F80E